MAQRSRSEAEGSEATLPRRSLPPETFEEMPGDEVPRYVPADREIPELTLKAVSIGIVLGMVFGAANAYVGLRVGLTVSGMTIATLIATSLIFVALGMDEAADARLSVLAVGAVVCIAAAIAGDTSQDLKTGFLVGATPWKQQVGEMVGVLTAATVMGAILILLHGSYGIGSETLPAPQATLMSLVIDGVLEANLPWTFVIIGIALAAIVEHALRLPSLAFAVGPAGGGA